MSSVSQAEALGSAYLNAGDYPRAEQVYRQILAVDPSSSHAWYLVGAISQVQGRLDESVECYRRALRLDPGIAEAWNNLGIALCDRGENREGLGCFREALRHRPDDPGTHNNLGNALQAIGDLNAAIDHYRHALRLEPHSADAHHNLGNALRALGELAEALDCYNQALRIRPDHAEMHLSRSLVRLQMGDLEAGWAEYEWRWRCPAFSLPAYPQPIWDGSPLRGRTILLHADHGLGDTIQFIRYTRLVKDRGGQVVVACQRELARLLTSASGIDQVNAEGELLPEFQVYAPIMSLPRIFGTTLESVPAEVPYLAADPAQESEWRRELETIAGYKVGIAWQGSPRYYRDRQRSFPLTLFAKLSEVPGVRLLSLQKGAGAEQLSALGGRFEVIDLAGRLVDFRDTAAVLTNLDLVITPDTSLAHLAGALGVPTWVALPFASDWRWLVERDDSPWYPSMRLFRQRSWGDWDDVFGRMARQLSTEREFASARSPSDQALGGNSAPRASERRNG